MVKKLCGPFEGQTRLRYDTCNKPVELDKRHVDYVLNNQRPWCNSPEYEMRHELAASCPNLRKWDGYGVFQCMIDVDSRAKYDPGTVTNWRCRRQLPNRLFQAVPALQRGTVLPALESKIQNGTDSTMLRQCDRLREKGWAVFPPVNCEVAHVPSWKTNGRSSRDIARSPEFLTSIGYVHNGRTWVRTGNSAGTHPTE